MQCFHQKEASTIYDLQCERKIIILCSALLHLRTGPMNAYKY